MVFHWPQITYLALVAFSLLIAAAKDGDLKTGKHRFSETFVSLLFGAALLYFGGFFNGTAP